MLTVTQLGGVNTYTNPLMSEGQLIHAVNVDSYPYGAKSKRPGYNTFLGTPDTSQVNTLFDWHRNDGTTFFLYRASGSSLYYSSQGTSAWTICGNGTITAGAHVGCAVLDDTMIICDGAGSTRHTTNGTAFTNTILAPVAVQMEQYQNRIYAAGTSSTLFYSTTNDATNWNLSGTSDSSSLTIPGAGKLLKIFKVSDMLCATKNSGLAYRWDGYNLVDTSTRMGPSSPYSVGDQEGQKISLNRNGLYGYAGGKFQLISNPIQRQFYNNSGSAMVGSQFDTAPADFIKYNYLLGAGTVTDDLTEQTINNAVIKYDFQKNEFMNYSLGVNPTAFCRYKDASLNEQMLFGDANGQVYQFAGTAKGDNGTAIPVDMIYVTTTGVPEFEKKFNWIYAYFNPGCQAQVQVAISNTYEISRLKWQDVGDVENGVYSHRFADGSRGRLLFVRVKESSVDSPFTFYGFSVDSDPIPR